MQRVFSFGAIRILSLLLSLTSITSPLSSSKLPASGGFLLSATLDDGNVINTWSDGDLWPSCWADDDNLYAANGDGRGFSWLTLTYPDIAINQIAGTLPSLSGITVAKGGEVGQVWANNGNYNRKPTSMACVDGSLYVAIQDLSLDFNDAPNASISRSLDHGRTWIWDQSAPMFDNYLFTTIMFLDYGKDYANAVDDYVYAYGLDYNWRDSNTHVVPDPIDLYLARVPRQSIQTRSLWEFYIGTDDAGKPLWSSNIYDKAAVLRNTGDSMRDAGLSQGGVVYNAALGRYIYSTWTQFAFDFYESPQPWGPWQHFLSKNFGRYPWNDSHHGGYGTTIPSKFISEDGREMWLQSNVCPCGNAGVSVYNFSLRRLIVIPGLNA